MSDRVLLVIDMLNDYLNAWEPSARKRLVTAVDTLVGWARARSVPVIWVRQEFEADLSDAFPEMKKKQIHITTKGTPGCRVVPELTPMEADHEVVKKRYSAFFRTDLDALLSQLGATTLILAGLNTHACIRTAAIDAYQRDYQVVIPRECVGSNDPRHHEISLEYMAGKIADVISLDELLR